MAEKDNNRLSAIRQINIKNYDYSLPDDRIAKYPLPNRDQSKLLIYRDGAVSENRFDRLPDLLPDKSLIVFNNTRVIQARLLFTKETGAKIEIFCLEPEEPRDYALNFQSRGQCRWICLVGNAKRWKTGTLKCTLADVVLSAKRIQPHGQPQTQAQTQTQIQTQAQAQAQTQTQIQTQTIQFEWDNPAFTFTELLDAAGVLPIPPYLHRETEKTDLQAYQTVYSQIKGSVAAPTAGLHFTPEVLEALDNKGFKREELTLHVGAGTFKPVQTATIGNHEMHAEFLSVNRSTIASLIDYAGRITAVGTTSVRTLESLYYIGANLADRANKAAKVKKADMADKTEKADKTNKANTPESTPEDLYIQQWTPYENHSLSITPKEALEQILYYLDKNKLEKLITSTQILIAPGYQFRIVNNMITNFHQPKSTLLLLVSAFVKGDWEKIYNYAFHHDFRFLSYGDSSLLFG